MTSHLSQHGSTLSKLDLVWLCLYKIAHIDSNRLSLSQFVSAQLDSDWSYWITLFLNGVCSLSEANYCSNPFEIFLLDYILKAAEFSYTTISDDFCFIRIPLVPAILNVTLQYITTTKWQMLYSKILWGKNIICIVLKYILMLTNKSRVY